MHPGTRNSLDALCKRYQVDASTRVLHGAVLDAGLLADVYLAMTGGQVALGLEEKGPERENPEVPVRAQRRGGTLRVIEPSPEEHAAHAEMLALLDKSAGEPCHWRRLDG